MYHYVYDENDPPEDLNKRFGNYISAQALEAVTIQEVAQAVHLSPSRLTHLFHQETGISPRLYLANLKLERAFYRMQEGMTLTEACMAAALPHLPTWQIPVKICWGSPCPM